MSFDFDKISYEIDQADTNGRYAKVDVYYNDVLKGSVMLAPKELIGTPDNVVYKIIAASVPLAKQLLGAIRYEATDQNLTFQVVDKRNALAMLEGYLAGKGTYVKADGTDGSLEFVAWMRGKFDSLTDQQIVDAMTG